MWRAPLIADGPELRPLPQGTISNSVRIPPSPFRPRRFVLGRDQSIPAPPWIAGWEAGSARH